MTQHTQGRLKLSERNHIYSENIELVAVTRPARTTEANARRLVAAWNACEGLPTSDLEKSALPEIIQNLLIAKVQRDELLDALKDLERVSGTGMPSDDPARIAARAAIAKAEGKA